MQVAFAGADVHVQDVRETDRNELGTEFAGDRAGEERLSTPGWAVQQQAAAKTLAVQLAQLRSAQWRKKCGVQPFLDVLHAADIGKRDARALDLERRHIGLGRCRLVDEHRPGQIVHLLLRRLPVEALPRRGVWRSRDVAGRLRCPAEPPSADAINCWASRLPGSRCSTAAACATASLAAARIDENRDEVQAQYNIIGSRLHSSAQSVEQAGIHGMQATRR